MKVTVNLDTYMVDAIADRVAVDKAYDWFSGAEEPVDHNELYAEAFADGMRFLIGLIEKNNEDD